MNLSILGTGAVTAAGWLTQDFITACLQRTTIPTSEPARTVGKARTWTCRVRGVPGSAPADLLPKSPRLRRASPLTKFEVAAAMQALSSAGLSLTDLGGRLGLVQVLQNGCVQYSVRFFAELQVQPELPSPLIFPETVFNAPASHLAQCLGVNGMVTTLIGEPNHLVEAVFTAQQWIEEDLIDHCLIVASEEMDWMTVEALSYYHPDLIASEGAAALLLGRPVAGKPRITALSPLLTHHLPTDRERVLRELASSGSTGTLIDHCSGVAAIDRPETVAWSGWPGDRWSPGMVLGDALGASCGLQWVLASHLATSQQVPVTLSMPGANASSLAVIQLV